MRRTNCIENFEMIQYERNHSLICVILTRIWGVIGGLKVMHWHVVLIQTLSFLAGGGIAQCDRGRARLWADPGHAGGTANPWRQAGGARP